jgi:hypothetical protein
MTEGKKVGPNDAHGGVRHKKKTNQARSGSKSPVCRIYAHGVRRVAHRGGAGPTSFCSVSPHAIHKLIVKGRLDYVPVLFKYVLHSCLIIVQWEQKNIFGIAANRP